jgi:4-hydroxy-tetrahydrodipicolinate reductase
VDIDPGKVGKSIRELLNDPKAPGLRVVNSLAELRQKPDLVFHTAVSSFKTAYPQLAALAHRGINVVSSCEELIYPRLRSPRLASQLDRICRQGRSRIVAAGVNPGFVMDLLPICLATATQNLDAIHVERVVNASTRRESLQRKIGSGMEPGRFTQLLKSGRAGHAGLKESLALLAHGLGLRAPKIRESSNAVIARTRIRTKYFTVHKGQTCGLHQRVEARPNRRLHLTLDLKMYLGADDAHDAIRIEGCPPVEMRLSGGVAGDQATVAALLNAAPRLLQVEPGLRLLTELPLA